MKRILAIARKEGLHILRDPRSLTIAVVMPMAMVIIFGFGIQTELRDLPIGILDLDRSPVSRDLIIRMTSGDFIREAGRLQSRDDIEPGFRRGRFRAAVVIPRGYARDLVRGREARVQVLIDGADATTAATVENYILALLQPEGPEPRLRLLFNPELESSHFIVPGLVAVILVMICALLTSVALARERETGTMEMVLTTPTRSGQLILGKVLPYLAVASVDAVLVLAVGRILFHVPMKGSWLILAGYSLVYLLIALSLGILISALARSQRVAMLTALLATLLPTMILSGFIFPLSSMPAPLQVLAHVIPATYYLQVIRGIMLKGEAWFPVQLGVMAAMAAVLLVGAVRRFQAEEGT